MWPFKKREIPPPPIIEAIGDCLVCGGTHFVRSGLVPWWVACGHCGTLYQIEGVDKPIARVVV